MSTQQKGFSVGAVLLLMVSIALVGAVSWYVWSYQNRSSDEQATNTIQEGALNTPESDVPSDTNEEPAPSSASWVRYSNESLGIAFTYPGDWGEVERIPYSDQGESDYFGFSEYEGVNMGGHRVTHVPRPGGGDFIQHGGFSENSDGTIDLLDREGLAPGAPISGYEVVAGGACALKLDAEFFGNEAYHGVCNTDSNVTPGFNFAAHDSSLVNRADFEQMVGSYETLDS